MQSMLYFRAFFSFSFYTFTSFSPSFLPFFLPPSLPSFLPPSLPSFLPSFLPSPSLSVSLSLVLPLFGKPVYQPPTAHTSHLMFCFFASQLLRNMRNYESSSVDEQLGTTTLPVPIGVNILPTGNKI